MTVTLCLMLLIRPCMNLYGRLRSQAVPRFDDRRSRGKEARRGAGAEGVTLLEMPEKAGLET